MESNKKTLDLLKFYFRQEKKQAIQLTCNNGIKVKGNIKKLPGLFGNSIIIDLKPSGQMKIHLDDIRENSILPIELAESMSTSSERKSIPQSVRMELWRNHFGEQYEGTCFVCSEKIKKDQFDAGHVIAHAEGGSDTADNMRPICKTCNTSMGTMNLKEFKLRYHS